MTKHNARLLLFLLLILSACAPADTDPADAVEAYLTAKIAGDEAAMRPLLCAEMESSLPREANAFSAVTGVTLENMSCARNGDTDTVTCTGAIVAEYGTENTTFPLETYRVVKEDDQWKWCGEAG